MRHITGAEDDYGLTTGQLHERLALITGSEDEANDAMAAIAEWLDTVRTKSQAWIDETEPRLGEHGRVVGASIADGFAQALSIEAEEQVSDSRYGLVEDLQGRHVHRRILHEADWQASTD